MPILTVTQINKYLSFKIGGDKNLQGIMAKGEISDFVCHWKSGHMYFSLKDSASTIRAVMFASAAKRLKFTPEDGMEVVVSGSVNVYERDGVYQLYVNDIIPEGTGKNGAALEQLKKKLEKEGIFAKEHKRPLPEMPKKIGVVTSLSGAAVRDIINVLTRRYPLCEVYAVDALVQGENAPDSICRGILTAENAGCDVIIVGRGGGSSEDLSAFNTEKTARAVYDCKVPVISAVGHEIDYTVTDLAADMRAPTPSAAAELAAPDISVIAGRIDVLERRIAASANALLNRSEDKLRACELRLNAQSPEKRLENISDRLDSLTKRQMLAFGSYISRQDGRLGECIARLESLSPLKVMARGYSLVYSGEKLVRSSNEINVGDTVRLRFSEGEAEAVITK